MKNQTNAPDKETPQWIAQRLHEKIIELTTAANDPGTDPFTAWELAHKVMLLEYKIAKIQKAIFWNTTIAKARGE